ncbi:ester cyclase [Pelagibius sp.]|uniref:nuclear transport factor 2 family protein n=1 Tax=Pelagibius sp. TaxID=1931238 RepID=UPI00260E5B43|nr:ester cyclase [Pelagibius sp.]
MRGFDQKYQDLPDYIIAVTKEIWEDRGIATLRKHYSETIPVRTPSSIVVGNEAVIAATMATLAEFPDRTLLGEDVIWSGDEEEGYLSSHRLLSTATHLGNGVYGAATGKTLRYRILADCAAKDGQIYDEWMVRDQGAVVRQLGIEPKRFAADRITKEGGPDHCTRPLTPETDVAGRYRGNGNGNDFGRRYADLLTRIMAADMAAIPQVYDRAAELQMPGGIAGHGWDAADRFWMGLRSAFPSAAFEIQHAIGREDPLMPPRAALRWSLHGKHDGFGAFGEPTGAMVYVMGISHAEFGPWGLRREWVLFDETAIWKQILMQTG